jgi:Alginate export
MTACHAAEKPDSSIIDQSMELWPESRSFAPPYPQMRHTMKTNITILMASASILHAGSPEMTPAPDPAALGDWIKPIIDIRTRYEYADIDGTDISHAWTFRERLGLKTTAWNGFSALIEGEFSQAVVDDFNGGALDADPFDPNNSLIADPETNELNQAFLQYEGFDTTAKIGRQRIKYDNDAFIGNVGWRQNEQTFDALSLSNKSIDGLTCNFAYLNQINRIFGSDADGPLPNVEDVAASAYLFNASYTGIEGLTLGGYSYIMNFGDLGAWDNNTFGLSAKKDVFGVLLYGELAWQDKAGLSGAGEALYLHTTATKSFGPHAFTLGVEHLDAGFKTPLATLHAFNGFADVFVAGRANGSHNGLTDTYLTYSLPVFWGMKWANTVHAMGDNELTAGYGWEYDSVLVKKFNDQFTAIAKFAWFNSEGDGFVGTAPVPDATRFSIELNYTF